jgi:hypothetical protein
VTDTVEEVTQKIKTIESIPKEMEDNNNTITNIKIMKKKSRRTKVNYEMHENPNIIKFLEKIYNICDSSKSCCKVFHIGK